MANIWNVKSMTLNYDGGLSGNISVRTFDDNVEPPQPIEKFLWSTDGGNDMMVRLDYETGSHIETLSPPAGHFDIGSGMVFDGTHLWYAETDENGDAILKLDPSDLSVIASIPAPEWFGHYDLAWDGVNLWTGGVMQSTGDSNIYKLNPADGSVISSFPAPDDDYTNGLAFDGQYLWWAGTRNSQTFYKVDPNGGSVIESWVSPVFGVVKGIDYDNGMLIVGNEIDGTIYRISLTGTLVETLTPNVTNYTPQGVAIGY